MADTHKDEKVTDEDNVKVVEEEEEKEKPRSKLMQAAEWRFLLTTPDTLFNPEEKNRVKGLLLDQVKADKMAPFYKQLCEQFKWPMDAQLLKELEQSNEEELKKWEAKIEDSKANAGDTEVREATLAKAEFLARIGEKQKAFDVYKDALALSVGVGSRIDVVLATIRLSFLHGDVDLVKQYVAQAKGFVESGGDWERRNLLKIYEAVYLLLVRDFKKAASLLLDSIATFTCYELFDYNTFIFYTVLLAIVSVDRVTLLNKVVKSPEILSSYREVPNLMAFLQSFAKCKYAEFFEALSKISDQILRDRFLAPHFGFYMREIRVVAYRQFLQSYRSVKLGSMAEAFGVSVPFLDSELSRFIAGGRLNCKIDKVNGIVETNRPDSKNAQYQATIKQGDLLLNRIQKLTKIISD